MRIKIYQPLAIHELGKRANQEDSIYPIEGKATENDRLFCSVMVWVDMSMARWQAKVFAKVFLRFVAACSCFRRLGR